MGDKLWATVAVALGLWETTALTTRKIPTITNTCALAKKRWRRRADAAIGLWLLGLGWHLLRGR
jgi:hypothetical protein